MSLPGYDSWKTGGNYSSAQGYITCHHCGKETAASTETEYGMTTWEPGECSYCEKEFDGTEAWADDEPDPDRLYDQMRERGNEDGGASEG